MGEWIAQHGKQGAGTGRRIQLDESDRARNQSNDADFGRAKNPFRKIAGSGVRSLVDSWPSTLRIMPIKVAIVEDDRGVRESLATLIQGTVGFQCSSGHPSAELALRELPKHWPDVVIMDINLP